MSVCRLDLSYTLSILTGKDKPDRLRIMTRQINSWIRVVIQSCVRGGSRAALHWVAVCGSASCSYVQLLGSFYGCTKRHECTKGSYW